MCSRENVFRAASSKSRKQNKNEPSFSSSLLDEIYRSIDSSAENAEDLRVSYREKPEKKREIFRPEKNEIYRSMGGNGDPEELAGKSSFRARRINHMNWGEDEETPSFRRDCLAEKWMAKEDFEKLVVARRKVSLLQEFENRSFQDNDLLFFSSNSSSSDSSGALSSSDTEFFGSVKQSRVSCFSSVSRPKPVKTGWRSKPEEGFPCGDRKKKSSEDELMKSKSRALKLYANLKKVKQPISPGGKLTSFINSLFNNAHEKKSKTVNSSKGFRVHDPPAAGSAAYSTCHSASSFSRSCLSKNSPKSRELLRNGIQRTVRFDPVSVIVGEDSRPCGEKSLCSQNSNLEFNLRDKIKNHVKDDTHDVGHDPDYTDDGASDSSSDLFELNHLALFESHGFSQELPVYETTYFNPSHVRANGVFR